ncbi:SUKH-3 domain-containing protein [Streptomyces sp. NBC_01498]|uniref:SUKH-3 domain-containing protein n=1 Tax=Streptomyces sp. NBC_01498 TaxID=2975870 RepID=UPI002E7C44D8|nr:SUKH-3 domain-containing protein [Streptomyces sp. NBC_01498]WTL26464.1 SUKH-3 domain-containing protein [Streptomyces sp. NBC_01498]
MPDLTTTRFPVAVDVALRDAGWRPGRWDMRQAEEWADTLRAHITPAGHVHAVFPAVVEIWAEFGGLSVTGPEPGRQIAPTTVRFDPLAGIHLARTLGDLGRSLDTEISPIGEEGDAQAVLAVDASGRVYSIDHTGDWYLGPHIDHALAALVTGAQPQRLTSD